MNSISLFAPAKINVFLAITGRRPDGFHNLVSVAAPLTFGDTLEMALCEGAECVLECDQPAIPQDSTNLVLKAAAAFRQATGWTQAVRFRLTKRVPAGAGLGGGSSDGTAALLGLNALSGNRLSTDQLRPLAAQLGSDCVLFLQRAPCLMRGRGESIEALPPAAAARLHGRRLLVFKPGFGIATAWAYGEMARRAPSVYLPSTDAEDRLRAWLENPDAGLEKLLYNNMESVAFEKYLALPTLLEALRREFGVAVGMSGSGSACFALLDPATPIDGLRKRIQESWGAAAFLAETQIG